jgi:hypothetical protein
MSLFDLEGLLVKVWRTLRMARMTKYAPGGVQRWVDRRREERSREDISIAATRLVPEEALERRYRDAIQLLLAEREQVHELGDYLEFGVYNGTSLTCMYKVLESVGVAQARLFGFDSFEGLPAVAATDDEGGWHPGQYKCEYKLTKRILDQRDIDWNRVTLVKGWFNDTLKHSLIERYGITKASVIMVDCDLYASAKEALSFCAPLIRKQAIIFFDDWYTFGLAEKGMGERRAFDEFLTENPGFVSRELPALRYSTYSNVFYVSR